MIDDQPVLTLAEFNERVVVPSVIRFVREGACDAVLYDEELYKFVDPRVQEAIKLRREALKGWDHHA